jgi:hypothetical protein
MHFQAFEVDTINLLRLCLASSFVEPLVLLALRVAVWKSWKRAADLNFNLVPEGGTKIGACADGRSIAQKVCDMIAVDDIFVEFRQ